MRIKATDIFGKEHWLHERPNETFVWGDESNASDGPQSWAMKWANSLAARNRYLDREDQMVITIERSIV